MRLLHLILSLIKRITSIKFWEGFSVICNAIRNEWIKMNFLKCGDKVRFRTIGALHGCQCICIGAGTTFGKDIWLTAWPELSKRKPHLIIGKNCQFGAYNHITCSNSITIGENLLTGKWVTITDNSHGEITHHNLSLPPIKRDVISNGAIIIEKNVWIGDKATILPGVTIGKGAIIAANAVVTHNVPAYSVVGGIPAKVIRKV